MRSAVTVRWIVVFALVAFGPAASAAILQFSLKIIASNGKAAGNLPVSIVSTDGKSADLAFTDAEGDITLALDSSKIGKRFNVYKVACSRIVLAEENSAEDKRCKDNQGTEPNGCRSCEPLGFFIFGESATIGTPSNATTGIRIGAFATAGGKWTTIGNADGAETEINRRADATNPPYNQRQIDIEKTGSGAAFGGGVQFGWGDKLGTRIGFVKETERNVPTQNVLLNQTAVGATFEQQGDAKLSSQAFTLAPTFNLGRRVLITGGLAVTNWNVDVAEKSSLNVRGQQVRSSDIKTTAKGTDLGVFGGVELYVHPSLGFSLSYTRTTLNNVYDPTASLGWPANWTDNNFFVGAVLRTPNLIR